MTIFEEIPALSPVQFFELSWDCPYVKGALKANTESRLPDTSELLGEEPFADVYMGWNEQKLLLEIRSRVRTQGDVAEFFFDTRNVKTKAQLSKFCHQFVFTPDEKEGVFGRETTRFRENEQHRLSDPKELGIQVKSDATSYLLQIEIPAQCLYGYDPLQFQRLGFTYRISRSGGSSQHFAVSSEEVTLEQHPSLWATVKLAGRK